jgi:uncharacterized membrane protein SpoIIM required for sporulation
VNIDEFIGERKDDWQKLEIIAGKLGQGSGRKLTREDLWQLGKLYASAASDLSVLKSSPLARDANNNVIAYLNSLVIRVHGMIYKRPGFHWYSLWEFIAADFPRSLRANFRFVAVSASVFGMFLGTGFLLGVRESGFIELLVPDAIISKVEQGQVWFKSLYTIAPQASSMLMTHNVSVTFLIIAAGISFGLGTVYLLALNGVLIGAMAALCYNHNLSLEFWSFVLPHGSLEISAIVIAGGAGLILGQALLDPGPYRRREVLSVRGREAGRLAFGCVPLLVLAGIIEAFVSPSPLPSIVKFTFAAVSFTAFIGYAFAAGRSR